MDKYPLMKFDEEAKKRDLIGQVKAIIAQGEAEEWDFSTIMHEIKIDITCLKEEIAHKNNIARDNIVRRELGLDSSVRLTSRQRAKVFNVFSPNGLPQE